MSACPPCSVAVCPSHGSARRAVRSWRRPGSSRRCRRPRSRRRPPPRSSTPPLTNGRWPTSRPGASSWAPPLRQGHDPFRARRDPRSLERRASRDTPDSAPDRTEIFCCCRPTYETLAVSWRSTIPAGLNFAGQRGPGGRCRLGGCAANDAVLRSNHYHLVVPTDWQATEEGGATVLHVPQAATAPGGGNRLDLHLHTWLVDRCRRSAGRGERETSGETGRRAVAARRRRGRNSLRRAAPRLPAVRASPIARRTCERRPATTWSSRPRRRTVPWSPRWASSRIARPCATTSTP